MKNWNLLIVLLALLSLVSGARAELRDQGLSSIMDIIDKAIVELEQQVVEGDEEADPAELEKAMENAGYSFPGIVSQLKGFADQIG